MNALSPSAEHTARIGHSCGVAALAPPGPVSPGSLAGPPGRIDTHGVKQAAPIEEVVARYGVDLRGRGRALVGRCPFHDDRAHPNLHVYPSTDSYFCYRCWFGGDVIDFVERYDGVGFREAVARLIAQAPALSAGPRHVRLAAPGANARREAGVARAQAPAILGPDERATLAAATSLYHRRLMETPAALAYVEGRGLDRLTVARFRLGYAPGGELAAHLRQQGLPLAAAQRTGLLREDGSELLTGRIVLPELRRGQTIWMIGRTLDGTSRTGKTGGNTLRYLGLPGNKPLMGWDAALEAAGCGAAIVVVEGPFDWLVLQRWGIPSLALVGTYVRPDVVQALARLGHLYLVFDRDDAGAEASASLAGALAALGCHAIAIRLPAVPAIKDVADLGLRPDGRSLFVQAVERTASAAAA